VLVSAFESLQILCTPLFRLFGPVGTVIVRASIAGARLRPWWACCYWPAHVFGWCRAAPRPGVGQPRLAADWFPLCHAPGRVEVMAAIARSTWRHLTLLIHLPSHALGVCHCHHTWSPVGHSGDGVPLYLTLSPLANAGEPHSV
jgi:hypothetical protein